MTQDPYGPPPGTGYVARGEVVPDDEANANPPTVPMTHFQKVASALRGDRAGVPADQDQSAAEGAGPDQAPAEAVGAVRSPDAGNWEYWDDEGDPTATRPDLYGAAARGETDPADPAMAADSGGPAAPVGAIGTAESSEAPEAAAEEPETLGRQAGAPVQDGLRPGEPDGELGDFSDLTYGSLLPDAAEFKARWQQVQFRFVDDPTGSVNEAADVVAQVTAKLEAAIAERQRAIAERQRALRERWSEGKSTDTESLRETLLMYRAFLDQLTGPKIS